MDQTLPSISATRRRCFWSLATCAMISLPGSQVAVSQTPAPSVSIGFGIDTSIVEVRDIVRLTRAYLGRPDSSARSLGLWSSRSAFDVRYGDLAREAYQGFPATIIGVSGRGTGDSVFVVKILHATASSTGNDIRPLAIQRLYATRASGSPYGWQFSSPLPRLTMNWARLDAGRMTFWYAPGQRQSRVKAQRASQFVDSVAHLFGVAPRITSMRISRPQWTMGRDCLAWISFRIILVPVRASAGVEVGQG